MPKKIILMGFTELTPQQKTFLTLCEKNGTYVSYETASIYTQTTGRICLADEETEIRTMARWAKTVFATHFEKKELVSIACIVPTLEKSREMILSIFSDVFSEKNTYTLDHTLLPFNISAGKSLASYPVIQTALQLLNLNRKEIPIENISQLLLSPFLGDAEQESIARAHYDVELRKKNNRMISIKKLISSTTCPLLAKRLKIFSEALPHAKKTFSSNTWTKIFVELLTQLGWPGERSLNSAEYQVVQRWLKILTEYETFDILFSSANYHRALHHLTQLAAATVFQPESPEAPVQILGILEAAELPFDYSWVMGMDDNNWPPSAKPNPFIPHLLQKTLKMPHATAERELDYTQSLIKQLKNSAKHAIFSHAMINKESELRPSTLITDFDELTIHQLNLTDFI
ncbi:MAG TPA: hypothetical protein VJL60_00855 [Gammaproteobacteria bacterium]|nr:hypothetical protein [Gammaproteobacteria bacterium]